MILGKLEFVAYRAAGQRLAGDDRCRRSRFLLRMTHNSLVPIISIVMGSCEAVAVSLDEPKSDLTSTGPQLAFANQVSRQPDYCAHTACRDSTSKTDGFGRIKNRHNKFIFLSKLMR